MHITLCASQLDQVATLLEGWRGTGALALNPTWATEQVADAHRQLADSFDMVYCFMPLAIQVCFQCTGYLSCCVSVRHAARMPTTIGLFQDDGGRRLSMGARQRGACCALGYPAQR